MRGPGELFGVRQSGDFSFGIADIYTDAEVLQSASEAVEQLLLEDPTLCLPQNAALVHHFSQGTNAVDFRSI